MKHRYGAMEAGLLKALILSVSVATVTRAGIAYLPLTGPPALRVMAVKSPKPVPAMIIEAPAKVAAAETNCPPLEVRPLNTNTAEVVVNSAGGNSSIFAGPIAIVPAGPSNPLDTFGALSVVAL